MSDIDQLPQPDLKKEALRLLARAQKQDITLRLFGGMAFHLRCPSTNLPGLDREYGDLDFMTNWAGMSHLGDFFKTAGYEPDRTLNTLYGDRRQLYFDEFNHRQVDILINEFEMCHTIPLQKRINIDPNTLPLAELLLTKTQIVELNHKDILDICALVLDHSTGCNDGESINLSVIHEYCAENWGLFTTVTENIEMIIEKIKNEYLTLSQNNRDLIQTRLESLNQSIFAAPKSSRWKMRALIGKRIPWFEEVEEVRR